MLGGTYDISKLCEHGFYDWFMFREDRIQYPDENPVLGRYLVLAIDVGPEMTSKIVKSNCEVVHCSTYRGLNEYEKSNQAHILLRKDFGNSIRDKLGTDISPDKFTDVNLEDISLYEIYEENKTEAEVGLAGKTKGDEYPVMATGLYRKVPTPEVDDDYVNDSVMLPIGNSYAIGKVTGEKIDADGNAD